MSGVGFLAVVKFSLKTDVPTIRMLEPWLRFTQCSSGPSKPRSGQFLTGTKKPFCTCRAPTVTLNPYSPSTKSGTTTLI